MLLLCTALNNHGGWIGYHNGFYSTKGQQNLVVSIVLMLIKILVFILLPSQSGGTFRFLVTELC